MLNLNLILNRLHVIVLVIYSFLIITSCSFKTVYNNLDYLIPAYIDRMVSINNNLSELVDLRTAGFIKWHREMQLPKYLIWLREVKVQLESSNPDSINYDQFFDLIKNTNPFWLDVRSRLSNELSHLLPMLNEDQVTELFDSLSEKNEEFIEKNIKITKYEQQQVYEERLIDNAEEWFGYLTDKQLKIIKDLSLGFKSLSRLRLTARLEWQRETRVILYSEDIIDKSASLNFLFRRLAEKQDEKSRNINIANKEQLAKVAIGLLVTLEEDQKQYVLNKLNYYINLIEDLRLMK